MPRPRFRLPLWGATVIVAAAYLIRAVQRGMDFRLDWPADAVALGLFALMLAIVAYVRRVLAREDDEAPRDDEGDPPAH